MRIKRATGVVTLSAAALLVLTACGGHGNGSSDSVDNAKNKARAVASSTANVAAENQVETQVKTCVNGTPTAKLLTSDGRQQVIACLKGLVPANVQDQFKDCVAKAAVNEKVWTKAGRSEFENEGVALCIDQATNSASATPSASK
jgi:hypothetical protein